ncbi:uncharacterized protein LOC119729007 isoform X2 [Patiria miniata]|nr:uncharacterized protein LOC119729007 isoform X2 [Patiria miniata]
MENDIDVQLDERSSSTRTTASGQITIRRDAVMDDLTAAFSDPTVTNCRLSFCMFQPHGEVEYEQGVNLDFKDVLDLFWPEFISTMTRGNGLKIPILRGDFDRSRWEGVGRIICKGWKDLNYFPKMLAPAFMETAVYGKTTVDTKEAFLQWIPEAEREVLEAALHEFPTDTAELDDIFRRYRCRTPPTEQNLPRLLTAFGHVEFVQRSYYAAMTMKPVLKSVFGQFSREEFLALYDNPRE